MRRPHQLAVVLFLPLLFAGCTTCDVIVSPYRALVTFDPGRLPPDPWSGSFHAGGACLTLPPDEAAWVSHGFLDSAANFLPTEIHVGEITRQVALRVLQSSFAQGVTEAAVPGHDQVGVYAKVDHFRIHEIFARPYDRHEDYSKWARGDYLALKLSLTVRFTTADGTDCWEKVYETRPLIAKSVRPKGSLSLGYDTEIGRLFQFTLVDLLQQAVRDFGAYRSAALPATSLPPAKPDLTPTPPTPTAP